MINSNIKNPTEKEQKMNDAFEMQVTYWRQNPHRFAIEFLKLNLHWWQQFVLWMMWHTGNIIFLASRGKLFHCLTIQKYIVKNQGKSVKANFIIE